MDLDRNQPRQRDIHEHRRKRLADGESVDASAIAANTTYVASYHTTGFYVATDNFFTTAFTSGVLTAPSTTTAGGNGVYAYGGSSTTGIFPTNTFSAANYWADVVFTSSAPNTAPTAVADTADATEKGGVANGSGGSPATGNVLTNDTDPDAGDTKTVTAVSFGAVTGTLGTALAGAHGSLVLSASGDFTYTVNETDAAVQALRQSTDTLTEVFSYTMRDTAGATSSTTLTVTIHGANDAPTLAAQTGSQNATVGSAFSLVLPAGTFTDVDAGDSLAYTATAADGSPLPAWLSFNAATRTFSGTPTTGDVGTLGVKVSATDLGGLAASETFNIVVTTTPNTAPTAVADTADATEKGGVANGSGGSPATGNVLTNDTDPDAGDTKTVTAVSFGAVTGTLGTALAGAHGSLVLSASGAFTYTVNETDAAVQALRQSTDTLTDVFSYTMRDTAGATSSTTLTVTIHGANDAPTLAVQTGSQNAIVGSAFSLVLPAGTFTDVDTGDSLAYTATAADGSPLPAWLSFNARDTHVQRHADDGRCRHARGQGLGHRSRRPRGKRDIQYRRGDDAEHRADGGRRHSRCHREGRRCQRLGRLARHRQCADQRHRSRRGRHQDRHRGQLRRGDRHAWHSARRGPWQPRAQCLGGLHLHGQRDGCRRAGVAAIDRYADRRLQLHHARYGRRHILDDAHGHHSRRQRRADACGADRQPERDRRLGLLSGAARRHLHRRRYRRQPHLHGDRRRRLATSRLAELQCRDTHVQRHAGDGQMSARSGSRSRPPISAASRQARHSISSWRRRRTPRRRRSPTQPMPPRRAALPTARAARPPPAMC